MPPTQSVCESSLICIHDSEYVYDHGAWCVYVTRVFGKYRPLALCYILTFSLEVKPILSIIIIVVVVVVAGDNNGSLSLSLCECTYIYVWEDFSVYSYL